MSFYLSLFPFLVCLYGFYQILSICLSVEELKYDVWFLRQDISILFVCLFILFDED